MLFTTDKQTLDDLTIFGRHGGDSIYQVFNRTVTRGGAALLQTFFQYPLSDDKAINKRSDTIRAFTVADITFPFESGRFDVIESYLSNTDERTRLSGETPSLAKKLGNLVAADADTAAMYKGISALVVLFKDLPSFLASLPAEVNLAYASEKAGLLALLADPVFEPVRAHDGKTKLLHSAMVAYDRIFRFAHRGLVQQLIHALYTLDVYLAVAKLATEQQFVFPRALAREQGLVHIEGVYHPQVKNAVPNAITITPGNNVIFLTGANMAGKSTFMKSVTIALYLAHMGFPVAASRMEFTVFDGIYTTINLPDNLGMGASHFYAEVLRVKKIAQELSGSKRLFIVFDELFRGTNVKDAYEGTIAIASGFARQPNSVFIISTHIIEAGEVLHAKYSNIHFCYLPTRMNGNKPVYTYTLEQGITDDRHGMVIINNEGILDILQQGRKKITQS